MRKSKLLLSIAIPKNSIPLNMEAEESSTTQEETVDCVPLDNRPNDN